MKKSILIILLLIPITLWGGQMPQLSQYMLNGFFINPAIAGTYNRYIIKAAARYQWIGFGPDAPNTVNVSMYGPHQKLPMGFGGYFYSDNTGPTSRNGIMGSYAYNIQISTDYRLSLGLSAGVMQYYIDGSGIVLNQANDPVLISSASPAYVPDANVGAYFYSSNIYVGLSSHQLIGNKLNIVEYETDTLNSINNLKRHVYLMGGYLFILNREWWLEPSALITASYPQPLQFEISCRAVYMKSIWAGLSYRTGDKLSLLSILTSYKHERKYEFGISYDLNFYKTSSFGFGSIEAVLGYWFDVIKK